eukprot:4475054-Pyramimonas_sp.AAC.1
MLEVLCVEEQNAPSAAPPVMQPPAPSTLDLTTGRPKLGLAFVSWSGAQHPQLPSAHVGPVL